jgi:hypothetical protein
MIATWLTPTSAEAELSPEHIARIQHHRYMLAEAWALQARTDPDTPQGERLAKLCGRLIFELSQTSPELAI